MKVAWLDGHQLKHGPNVCLGNCLVLEFLNLASPAQLMKPQETVRKLRVCNLALRGLRISHSMCLGNQPSVLEQGMENTVCMTFLKL